ncbi:MAG: hypothetical protein ACREQ9_01380, partial [Candidatus Binatia bacterium]
MKREASGVRGIAFLAVLPWMLAAAGLAFAASRWAQGGGSAGRATIETADPAELKTLRLALATETAENAALRSELDRLVGQVGAVPRPAAAAPGAEGAA